MATPRWTPVEKDFFHATMSLLLSAPFKHYDNKCYYGTTGGHAVGMRDKETGTFFIETKVLNHLSKKDYDHLSK